MSLAERLSKIERPDHTTEVRDRFQGKLVESLGPKLYDATLSDKDLQELVHRRMRDLLDEEQIPLSAQEKAHIIQQIGDNILGIGPIEPCIRHPELKDTMA